MRKHYFHLPNPILFSAKRHKRKSYFHRIVSDTDFLSTMLIGASMIGVYVLVSFWMPLG